MPDTSPLATALLALLTFVVGTVFGLAIGGRRSVDRAREAYRQGRIGAYQEMIRGGARTDDGSRLLGEIADGYELSQEAEWSRHG
jgi:UPF0716 family protein affecting phage T7 exclusion